MEVVTIKEGSEDGDRAVKAVLMERIPDDPDDDSIEFAQVYIGSVATTEDIEGNEVTIIDIDDSPQNAKSVGGRSSLRAVGEALLELDEKVNGQ